MKYKTYPAYRETEIEWIGSIPSEWESKRLKYICSVNDESLSETTCPDYYMRYVDIGSVTFETGINEYQELLFENAPSRARRIVRKGDIIVSTVRTYLKAISRINDDQDVIVSTGFAVIRPQKICDNYLSYLVKTPYFIDMVSANSVGVSYPAINPSEMMNIEVPIPSFKEQQEISVFLDKEVTEINNVIKQKIILIERLKEKRNAVITLAVSRGTKLNVNMKPSNVQWVGAIPESWKVSKIKYNASIKGRIGFKGYNVSDLVGENDDGALAIGGTNINKNGELDLSNKTFISDYKYHESPEIKLYGGEILMTKVGAGLGQVAIVPDNIGKATINPNVMILRNLRINPKPELFISFLYKCGAPHSITIIAI